jgi:hypothetical protein
LSAANGAPRHGHKHLYLHSGNAGPANAFASQATGGWISTARKPVKIFGLPVDP